MDMGVRKQTIGTFWKKAESEDIKCLSKQQCFQS